MSAPPAVVELTTTAPNGDSGLPLREFARRRAAGETWPNDLHEGGLRIRAGDVDVWGAGLPAGQVAHLTDQLDNAADRLSRGEPALIRAALRWEDDIPYLLAEPSGDTVELSLCFIPEGQDPLSSFERGVAELYRQVIAERDEIAPDIRQVPVDRGSLIAGLRAAAASGHEAYAAAGLAFEPMLD
jgi:hypothetical protein